MNQEYEFIREKLPFFPYNHLISSLHSTTKLEEQGVHFIITRYDDLWGPMEGEKLEPPQFFHNTVRQNWRRVELVSL